MDTPAPAPAARIAGELTDYIRHLGALSPGEDAPPPEADLFDSGYLDSLSTVTLTAHIQATYGVAIGDQDLFDPALTTIAGLAGLIAARAEPHATRA